MLSTTIKVSILKADTNTKFVLAFERAIIEGKVVKFNNQSYSRTQCSNNYGYLVARIILLKSTFIHIILFREITTILSIKY
jgi:hypothetical protein